jgi:GTP cyclohydrolase I
VTDVESKENAIHRLLELISPEIDQEARLNTPARVSDAMDELYCGYECDPAEILSRTFESVSDEMVIVRGIPLYSMCEHHMLPFIGKAHVGYIPEGRIVGISKIPRLIECYARRLQLQERLTSDIANAFMEHIKPRGVGVIIVAEHTCMTMRGINKPGTKTITSAMRGMFKDDEKTRNEFLELIKIGGARDD